MFWVLISQTAYNAVKSIDVFSDFLTSSRFQNRFDVTFCFCHLLSSDNLNHFYGSFNQLKFIRWCLISLSIVLNILFQDSVSSSYISLFFLFVTLKAGSKLNIDTRLTTLTPTTIKPKDDINIISIIPAKTPN